ncbi:MAG: glycosyltransferase family 39 protein [Armatimonadetes bacterium]|nr:glycosyltransferase family 39 protein [Armatimonadota bacterium]
MRHRLQLNEIGAVLLLTAGAFLIRTYGISFPPNPYFDEEHYVPAALALLNQQQDPNWVHPPLAKWILAGAVGCLGNNPLGWRLPSVLIGTAMIPIQYTLGRKLLGQHRAALFAAFLLSLDFLHIVQSRIATLDIYLAAFLLTGFLALVTALDREKGLTRSGLIFLSALLFGLALLTKGSALFGLLGAGAILLNSKKNRGEPASWAILLGAPLLLYILAYLCIPPHRGIHEVLSLHARILGFHARSAMEHPYTSHFWEWPFVLRPIWYFFSQPDSLHVKGILAAANPVLWWAGFVCICYTVYNRNLRSSMEGATILATYLFQLLPWGLFARGGFFYYVLPAVPSLYLAIALTMTHQQPRLRRGIEVGIVVVAIAGFLLFFPLLSGISVSAILYNFIIFTPRWI